MSSAISAPPTGGNAIDRYFKISERGSTLGREIRGGVVTFFTMAYIIVLNPLIIGTVKDGTGHFLGGSTTAPNLPMVAACTALVAGVMSILMGSIANYPLAIAAGLGLNAFVTFSVAALPGMTWQAAMGLVVLEGVVMLILVLSGFRVAVFRALPPPMKIAISVGIGMFIAFIGFFDSGFSRAGVGTPVQLGVGGLLRGWPVLVFCLGVLAMIVLHARRVKGGILIAIVGATILAVIIEKVGKVGSQTDATGKVVNPNGWGLNVPKLPSSPVKTPEFSMLGHIDLFGGFAKAGFIAAVLIVFSLVLADFFDTMGTMVAIGAEGDLLDEDGTPVDAQKILVVDSLAAVAGGAGSVSSNTGYIESASGVGDGARTGLAAITTGVLFLLSTFLSPLVGMVPYEAATPALVLVGFLMMRGVKDIDWNDIEIALPAFLTIVLMPFTYSITVGIGAGAIAFVVLKIARGKARQVPVILWIVAAAFLVYFGIDPIKQLFGIS